MAKELTQVRLKGLLNYDPITGEFTWLIDKARAKRGTKAGSLRKTGYRVIQIDGKKHGEHRLAWLYSYGTMPTLIDHKDRIPSNNSLSNLRECTVAENAENIGVPRNNTTGAIGVRAMRTATGTRFCARIGKGGGIALSRYFHYFEGGGRCV